MQTEESFKLAVDGRTICGVLHFPVRPRPACVISCHGLFSSKDSEKFTDLAAALTREGFAVIRFDFSGCGASTGDIAETTVTRRYGELEAVVRFAAGHRRLAGPCGLLGSSLGGYLALQYAARNRVPALSVWATPASLAEIAAVLPDDDRARLRQGFFSEAAACRLADLIGGVRGVQVLHGGDDELVPCRHARQLFELLAEPKMLEIFPGGDHSLSDAAVRQKAIELACAWFSTYLR